jgi:hypothetical protein
VKTWLLVGVVAVLTGCGGDDASTSASTTATTATTSSGGAAHVAPEPAQPVAELVTAIEGLDAQSDCAEIVKLINPADLPEPTGGTSPRNCAGLAGLLRSLRAFKSTDSAEFGTAAIIDGVIGGKDVAFVAALDETKDFKMAGLSIPRHEVGTKPRTGVDFKAPAAAYVKALRDGDCKAAHAAVASFTRLAYASEKQFCSQFKATYETAPGGLAVRLRADPGAHLVDLGATRDWQFFGLATEPAGYRTIVVGKINGGGLRVSDSVPVER